MKFLRESEDKLELVKEQALAQTSTIDALFRGIDSIREAMRVKRLQLDKLVADSPDGTLGSFDIDRVNDFIAKASPIFSAEGGKVKDNLVAEDLVTNEFIDPTVSLGG